MTQAEQAHLGGYVQGGDEATLFPDLWEWLVRDQGVRSMIDVGCGEGHAVRAFRELGCRVRGIDGVAQDDEDILQHDYTRGAFTFEPGFDLVWSCEFVEHVEEQYARNYLETFRCGRLLLMTHADPGQPGWHHVNCQPREYWLGMLAAIGFEYDPALTVAAHAQATHNRSPWNHFLRAGLAFRRHP